MYHKNIIKFTTTCIKNIKQYINSNNKNLIYFINSYIILLIHILFDLFYIDLLQI